MLVIRSGGSGDIPAVLALLDRAAEWLVAQGRIKQWGTGRQSTSPRRLEQAKSWAIGGLWCAVADDEVVGALVVGSPPAWVPAVGEPDLYIKLLVADHRYRGVGLRLLEHARVLAEESGALLVRLDCFAGDDGKLVRYYENNGFTVTAELEGKASDGSPWPYAILEQGLRQPPSGSDVFRRYCLPGGRYKKLIGGNFIRRLNGDALIDFGQALASDARSISLDELSDLLQGDWRERLTGAWLAGFARTEEMRDKISELLLAAGEPYAAKGYVFALARFGSAADGLILRRYLDKYLQFADLRADQPYAMGALLFIDRRLGADSASGLLGVDGVWERWAVVDGFSRPDEQEKRAEIEAWCDFAGACMRDGS